MLAFIFFMFLFFSLGCYYQGQDISRWLWVTSSLLPWLSADGFWLREVIRAAMSAQALQIARPAMADLRNLPCKIFFFYNSHSGQKWGGVSLQLSNHQQRRGSTEGAMFTLPLPPYLIAGGDATWGKRKAPCALLTIACYRNIFIFSTTYAQSSRHNFQAGRNMREAEGHGRRGSVYTNTASQDDWLPWRAHCEKSIWHSSLSATPPPPHRCL